jgi:membrane-bound lytic murein transglycosylase A
MAGIAPAALPGWRDDDHAAALAVYRASAGHLPRGWPVQPDAGGAAAAREMLEQAFVAVRTTRDPARITGYYEPELTGSPWRTAGHDWPLHALPPDPPAVWPPRAELLRSRVLDGHALAWLSDPLDAFLAQVQGSVRIRMPDGAVLRLGFAGRNGHPYHSIGAELIRRGAVAPDAMTLDAIRGWCRANPDLVPDLLATNPSYVFFRVLDLPAHLGPPGSLGLPLAPLRSAAFDPDHVPPGALVWIAGDASPLPRLAVAQDRGSAIRGAGRADLFFGTGPAAGAAAGRLNVAGGLFVLWPRGGQVPR